MTVNNNVATVSEDTKQVFIEETSVCLSVCLQTWRVIPDSRIKVFRSHHTPQSASHLLNKLMSGWEWLNGASLLVAAAGNRGPALSPFLSWSTAYWRHRSSFSERLKSSNGSYHLIVAVNTSQPSYANRSSWQESEHHLCPKCKQSFLDFSVSLYSNLSSCTWLTHRGVFITILRFRFLLASYFLPSFLFGLWSSSYKFSQLPL